MNNNSHMELAGEPQFAGNEARIMYIYKPQNIEYLCRKPNFDKICKEFWTIVI